MAYLKETANTVYDAFDKFAAFCVANAGYTRVPSPQPNVIIEKGKIRYRFDTTIVSGHTGCVDVSSYTDMLRLYMGYAGGKVEQVRYSPVQMAKFTPPFVGVEFIGNKHDQAMILEAAPGIYIHIVIGKVVANNKADKTTDAFEYLQVSAIGGRTTSPGGVVEFVRDSACASTPFGAGWYWPSTINENYCCNVVRIYDTNNASDFRRTSGKVSYLNDSTSTSFPDKDAIFEPLLLESRTLTERTENQNTGRTALSPIRLLRFKPELAYRHYYAGEVETVRMVSMRFLESGALLDGEWRVYPYFSRVPSPTQAFPYTGLGLAYNVGDY